MNITTETKINNEAVDRFAIRMKETLISAQLKGRSGWYDPDVCSRQSLLDQIRKYLLKSNPGNWVDIACFCMMLHELSFSESALEATAYSKNEYNSLIPEGYVLAPSELTAENGAKYLLLGEFAETTTVTCTACSYNLAEEGDCEVCGGEGEYSQDVAVSWTNIKAIYRKAIEELALPTEAAA
ncbi:hypothetical protein [Microbulbifer variabilis]|uniref:hypothetical protein n=1 Tax=Microbulbifer variabilis TaxID=266805 RepID=UPI001CFF2031|nr:hypothetical protein [Microbulbifer variabilis]